MATKIAMPKLSDTMEEGIILKWLKKEGEPVKQGEIIAEVQTDKADMELEAYDTGVLRKIFVPEGKGAAVGKPIAIIGTASEDISSLLVDTTAPSSGHGPAANAPTVPKGVEQIQHSAAVPPASGGDGDERSENCLHFVLQGSPCNVNTKDRDERRLNFSGGGRCA